MSPECSSRSGRAQPSDKWRKASAGSYVDYGYDRSRYERAHPLPSVSRGDRRSPPRMLSSGKLDEAFEMADARRVAHFAQCFGFDLADALAGDLESLADLLQGCRGKPSTRPNRCSTTSRSRSVSVSSTSLIFPLRMLKLARSIGLSACTSSMKSPTLVPSASPTGDSSEMGCCAILRTDHPI